MSSDTIESGCEARVEVFLDGLPVRIPSDRRSPAAIRCYLDTLALDRQRILYSFSIDGHRPDPQQPLSPGATFHRVEGETLDLQELPLQLVKTAGDQLTAARQCAESAIVLVLINDGCVAREYWWELARKLKEPLLTLSLLPENVFGPANSSISLAQLRRWQLEQLATILKDVDQACWSEDTRVLSNALENRVMPWLESLNDSIALVHDTLRAGAAGAENRCVQC
jgi:hypothetical protein